ncbi:MAG: hydrogenase expression protein HupH [Chloroflexota bacterium]|nr:MAG: hydrogenase expression protein HupH [Chloroflexota bacterium]
MRKRIRVVTPITTVGLVNAKGYQAIAGPDTEISVVQIDRGPASIESEFDKMLAIPDTVFKIMEAEREGMDAVVINAMGDPGLHPARQVVSIPVVGPAEATMHIASMLGHRFSVVTILGSVAPMLGGLAKTYGVFDKLASARWIGIPVLELETDPKRLVESLVQESITAIKEDGAHVIVLGCTGMFGLVEAVQSGLAQQGYGEIPVLDPIPVAIRMAEALVDLRLTHSKLAYPPPSDKRIVGFDVPARK